MTTGRSPAGTAAPPARPAPSRRSAVVEAVVTALFTTWVAWPFLSPAGYVTGYDTVTYGGPNLAFTYAELGAGRLPVWNDTIFGGAPFAANAQTAVFSPLQLLAAPLGAPRALDVLSAVHLFLLAFGVLVLVRRGLRLRAPAGTVAAAVVVGGGTVMARSLQFEQLAVVAWVPWVLVAVDAAVHTIRPARAVAVVGLAVAALLVAGHPQQIYLAAPLVVLWAAVRAVDAARASTGRGGSAVRAVGRSLGIVALGGLLGLGLAAVPLAVTAAQLGDAATFGTHDYTTASHPGYSVRPAVLASTLLGDVFSEVQTTTADSSEAMGAVGVAAAVLALVGLGAATTRRRREPDPAPADAATDPTPAPPMGGRPHLVTAVGLALAAVTAVVLALGPRCSGPPDAVVCDRAGAVYRAAFRVVPGFAQARVPGRWLLVATLALALLAALGVDAVARGALDRRVGAVAGAGALGLVLVGLALHPAILDDPAWRTALAWVVTATITTALVVAAATAARHRTVPVPDPDPVPVPVPVPDRPGDRHPAEGPDHAGTRGGPRPVRVPQVAAGVLAALVLVELGAANAHSLARANLAERPFTELSGSTATFLADEQQRTIVIVPVDPTDLAATGRALQPNSNQPSGVRSVDGYDGGLWVTRPWVTAMASLTTDGRFDVDLPAAWQLRTPLDAELLARFGVSTVVFDPVASAARRRAVDPSATPESEHARVLPDWTGPLHTEGTLEVWRNPRYTSEARTVHRVVSVPTGPDASATSRAVTDALRHTGSDEAVVTGPAPPVTCDPRPIGCGRRAARIDRPHPGEIRVVADDPDAGLLVVPEQHLSGWSATVDGRPQPTVTADGMGIGVPLAGGRHEVVLTYAAPGLRVGLVVAALSTLVLAALLLVPILGALRTRRARRRTATPASPAP